MATPRSAMLDSLTEATRTLVTSPSCHGDSKEGVLAAIGGFLGGWDISYTILRSATQQPLAGFGVIDCGLPGKTFALNAPADTASAGDPKAWRHDPFGGVVDDGWLYGRGSADSKAGIAIFCHVAREIARQASTLRGRLVLIFDADEHAGTFAGIRQALEQPQSAGMAGVYIGYPGQSRIITGCRGFYRTELEVHGVAAHSGASRRLGINAISRAARLIGHLDALQHELPRSDKFAMPPKLSVTGIEGGSGFSTVPDRCCIKIDCRLTPEFDAQCAERILSEAVIACDEGGDAPKTTMRPVEGWPAYQLSASAPILDALQAAARLRLGHALPTQVAGPSSIGNYLATRGVDATSGFGVRYRNIHAADECIEIASLEPAFDVYFGAVRALLH